MILQFNQIILDTAQYRLCVAGNPESVEPQVFNLLVYLVKNRNRVVTRGELLENLWQGKVVTDSALGARLKDARKVVGDSGDRQEVIKTIHGRGYQFIAQVVEINEDEGLASDSAQGNNILGNKRSAPSIGVVRFSNLSNNPDQQYFSDGISTNVWSGLARIRALVVNLQRRPSIDWGRRQSSANREL